MNVRGFTASPLLGTPQGVSVFVDGAVGWFLLPVPVVLTTVAAVSARQVVAESVEAHASLARVRRL